MDWVYYEVRIIKTSAALFSSNYCGLDFEILRFDTLEEARAAIAERYYKKYKCLKTYQKNKVGESRCVYRFRRVLSSDFPIKQRNQQDWVSIHKIEIT